MPQVPTRKIGNEEVPIPGLGCMGLTAFYKGERDPEKCMEVLKLAYDLGQTFWDTADMYGDKEMGENERLIDQAIKKYDIPRQKLFVASKFGFRRSKDGSISVCGTPQYVKEACEQSLRSLGMDYIDLYYQHRVDKDTPIEETVRAMEELRKAGKVRYLGLSECSAETLRKACKVAKIDALQIEYSLWQTDIETNGILEACRELDVTLIAYSPLGRGMLTGAIKSRKDLDPSDFRFSLQPRFSEENFHKNLELIDRLKSFAQSKSCTPAQLALAWVHSRWEKVIAIPGTSNKDRLKENLGCNQLRLKAEEILQIESILDTFKPQGEQYDELHMSLINK